MVSVMKLEKAPQESYADIGGLDTQIQEIKVSNTSTDKVVWNQSCVRDTSVLQLGLLKEIYLSQVLFVSAKLSKKHRFHILMMGFNE